LSARKGDDKMTERKDIHQRVTDSIIKCLEEGVKPWNDGLRTDFGYPCNPFTGKNYNGINVMILMGQRHFKKYRTHKWATKNQILKAGGDIKKNQQPTEIVLYSPVIPEGRDKPVLIVRSFLVFNLNQTKGLTDIINKKPRLLSPKARLTKVDSFIKRIKASIKHYPDFITPCYDSTADKIRMPDFKLYKTAPEYYATLLHEHIHWTGAKKRLNRLVHKSYDTYAFEELVAEIGAASLNAQMQIPVNIENHASYVAEWLKLLQKDKRAIFKAASAASKACQFLKQKAKPKAKKR